MKYPPELRQIANTTIQNLLHETCQKKYKNVYKDFKIGAVVKLLNRLRKEL